MADNNQRPLSELATRYKHPTGRRHKIIAHTGKSGLTPIHAPHNYRSFLSQSQRKFIRKLEAYQRRRCSQFTVQQLVDLEAFAPSYNSWDVEGRTEGGVNLQVLQSIPIHPLFEKSKWNATDPNHIGKVPLGQGRSGYFEPQNPLVWDALDPCLRLASAVMSNCHTLAWWEALFHGDYEYLEEGIADDWKGGKLVRFKPWSNPQCDAGRLHQRIVEISDNIHFWLSSGWFYPTSDFYAKQRSRFLCGCTYKGLAGEAKIFIASEQLEPLMRNNLTPAERKLDIFRFTSTMLHEICHAFWLEIQHPAMPPDEPYFDTQPLAELGFSMEQAVFGGRAHAITDELIPPLGGGQGLPSAAIISTEFFYEGSMKYTSYLPAVHPLPLDWEYDDRFPIPIGYFEDLFRPEFWDHARKYGTEATRMGPKTLGTRFLFNAASLLSGNDTWSPSFDPLPNASVIIDNGMPIEEQRAASLENLRQARAHRLHRVMNNILEQTEARDHSFQPMEEAAPHPNIDELDPDHFATLGKNFKSVSVIDTESSHGNIPTCPRYEEIRAYLLANRAQGRLCLDTMLFFIPVYTLLHYIEVFGGLIITPEEWVAFLVTCADRGEMFLYNPKGNGKVKWIEPPPIGMADVDPAPAPPPPTEQLFRDLCVPDHGWLDNQYPDFDFWYLLNGLQFQAGNGGAWLDTEVLRDLVNWHELHGDLWCWGPNWIVRRKLDTWPSQTPLSSPVTSSEYGGRSSDSDGDYGSLSSMSES